MNAKLKVLLWFREWPMEFTSQALMQLYSGLFLTLSDIEYFAAVHSCSAPLKVPQTVPFGTDLFDEIGLVFGSFIPKLQSLVLLRIREF